MLTNELDPLLTGDGPVVLGGDPGAPEQVSSAKCTSWCCNRLRIAANRQPSAAAAMAVALANELEQQQLLVDALRDQPLVQADGSPRLDLLKVFAAATQKAREIRCLGTALSRRSP